MNNKTIDELLKSRRSIRNFLDKEIPGKDIDELLSASSFSPSPSNCEPVRYIRFNSEESRKNLEKALAEGRDSLIARLEKMGGHCCGMMDRKLLNYLDVYYKYSLFMLDAPLLLAVGIKKTEGFAQQIYNAGIVELKERISTEYDITAGIYLQSFMLKAEEKGIGTCVLTSPLAFLENPEKLTSQPNLAVKCFLAAGYPSEKPESASRLKADDLLITI